MYSFQSKLSIKNSRRNSHDLYININTHGSNKTDSGNGCDDVYVHILQEHFLPLRIYLSITFMGPKDFKFNALVIRRVASLSSPLSLDICHVSSGGFIVVVNLVANSRKP